MQLPEVNNLKVKDIKLVKSVQMNKDDPISTAISIMYEKDVDQVPIFDAGEIFGIISFRDILRKYLNWSPKRDVSAKFNAETNAKTVGEDFPKIAELPVSNFSTNNNLVSVVGNVSLSEAIDLMLTHNVSSLLVRGDSGVEGMLSVKNLLRAIGSLKVPENFNIKYVGLNDLRLSESQLYNLKKITSNEAFKIQRQLKKEFSLTIQFKEFRKEGKQHQYAVNLKVEFPGQMIATSQEGWDFETALRKTFNNVKSNLEKKFQKR
jgi:CBS domain-containing protein